MICSVEPAAEKHFAGIYAAFGVVVAEKKYLAFTEQLPWEQSLSFYQSLVEQSQPYFVAVEGEKVVGWCDVSPVSGHSRAHIGVLGIALLPEARHKGLGAKLLHAAIDRAWARGLTRLELSVRTDNINAKKLYEQFGFLLEGTRRNASLVAGHYHDVDSMALLR